MNARAPTDVANSELDTPLQVLHEGAHHVVVNKPANMVVVRGRGVPRPTLLDLIQERYTDDARPVHRIDRGTTGCCVFARTEFGQQALSEAFRRRVVDKRYLAIVEGEPAFTKLAIDARLLRVDAPDNKRGALAWQTIDDAGQRALTRVRVLAKKDGRTLVEARLETGRMHQIRAHLAHVGHPIVLDTLYGRDGVRNTPHAFALHAFALSIPVPGAGGRAFITAPLPPLFVAEWGDDVESDIASARDQFLKSEAAAERAMAAKPAPAPPSRRNAPPAPEAKRSGKKRRRDEVKIVEGQKSDEKKRPRLTDDASKKPPPKRGPRRKPTRSRSK